MKKLLVVAALAGTAVVGWRWRHEPAAATEDTIEGILVANRFWVDHFPKSEKDTVRVFALWTPESFGVFADQNRWRVELERFRYEIKGDTVHALFPLSGTREDLTLNASRCREADWDFCLEVRGSSHGTKRYYSRLGWERRDRSVEQFMADVTAAAR
jgi:hypothetical protein